jgi:Holliday junction resolvase RusA-like endonuclease
MRALPKSKHRKFALPSNLLRFLDRLFGEPDTFKPDVDNLAKAVMDALNCVAYVDDSQVIELVIRKFPRVKMPDDLDALRVTISPVTDMLYPYVYRD